MEKAALAYGGVRTSYRKAEFRVIKTNQKNIYEFTRGAQKEPLPVVKFPSEKSGVFFLLRRRRKVSSSQKQETRECKLDADLVCRDIIGFLKRPFLQ